MKKLIAILVSLTLILSTGAIVFADDIQTFPWQASQSTEGRTQILTTEVPTTTWTLIIPADCYIPYRTNEMVVPGKVEITDVKNPPQGMTIYATLIHSGELVLENNDMYTGKGEKIIHYNLLKTCHYYEEGRADSEAMPMTPDDEHTVATHDTFWCTLTVKFLPEYWDQDLAQGPYSSPITYRSAMGEAGKTPEG